MRIKTIFNYTLIFHASFALSGWFYDWEKLFGIDHFWITYFAILAFTSCLIDLFSNSEFKKRLSGNSQEDRKFGSLIYEVDRLFEYLTEVMEVSEEDQLVNLSDVDLRLKPLFECLNEYEICTPQYYSSSSEFNSPVLIDTIVKILEYLDELRPFIQEKNLLDAQAYFGLPIQYLEHKDDWLGFVKKDSVKRIQDVSGRQLKYMRGLLENKLYEKKHNEQMISYHKYSAYPSEELLKLMETRSEWDLSEYEEKRVKGNIKSIEEMEDKIKYMSV